MRARRLALGLAALAPCWACVGFASFGSDIQLTPWAKAQGLERFEVDAGRYIGLSDMTRGLDANGVAALYLLPERQRALLRLTPPAAPTPEPPSASASASATAPPPTPQRRSNAWLTAHVEVSRIEGVPLDHDTESLTWLGPDLFAVGTETPWPSRAHDDVLVVRRQGHIAKVVARWPFPYAPFGLRGESNAGLEGLCSTPDVLLVASETVGKAADGGRFAPLGLRSLRPAKPGFVPLRLALLSATGKISALTCRPVGDASGDVEVLAIERHYGVGHVLRFVVPRAPAAQTTFVPQKVLDLAPLMPRLANYEGMAWLDNGDVLLVSDNSMGFATGPTEALRIPKALLEGHVTP